MTFQISKKNPVVWLVAGGAALLVVAAWLWCAKVSVQTERVFWGMIEQSLSTRAVTIQAQQTDGSTSADQIIRYSLGADNRSHSLTTLKQGGTEVTNELIATPTLDFRRFVAIKTDQKRPDGSPIDTSKLIGVWAKGQEGAGQFFPQAVVGGSLPVGGIGVPIGNLTPAARAKLVTQIRNDKVYQVSFGKVKKERVDGRLLYTYQASVRPNAYVAMIKQYSSGLGLHDLDQVNPEDYLGQEAFTLDITVDARARQVVRIVSEDGQQQTYSSYNVPVRVELPKNTITGEELQNRLADLQ